MQGPTRLEKIAKRKHFAGKKGKAFDKKKLKKGGADFGAIRRMKGKG